MSPASDGEPFSAGVPPYPAPGRREQPAMTARHMPVSSIVVITVCVLLTIPVLFVAVVVAFYVVVASLSF